MEIRHFAVGDVLVMKKHHACSPKAFSFAVLMAGSDVKARCLACGHDIVVPRVKLEKHIRKIEPAKESSDV